MKHTWKAIALVLTTGLIIGLAVTIARRAARKIEMDRFIQNDIRINSEIAQIKATLQRQAELNRGIVIQQSFQEFALQEEMGARSFRKTRTKFLETFNKNQEGK